MSAPIQSASLYVGDLDKSVTEADLFEIFNSIGAVASIRVCRDATSKVSLGYAYVNFHSTKSASAAIEQLNGTSIKGKNIRVMWSQRDPSLRKSGVGNIFIKNLDKSIEHRQLYDTFSDFGRIVSCKIAQDEKGNSKGYGFVHYETDEMAENAIKSVNEMLVGSQIVYVGKFISAKERHTPADIEKAEKTFTNVYVKHLTDSDDDNSLRALFAPFGEITSTYVKSNNKGKSQGFGFVNFKNHEDAKKAVDELNGKPHGSKTLYVARAQMKLERARELAQKYNNEPETAPAAPTNSNNLYIKNLSDDIDDNRLQAEFANFGSIISAQIMKDDKGSSKGFGFVCYETPEQASVALKNMNGRVFGSKPISISFAQRKQERQQQLIAQHSNLLKQGLYAQNSLGSVVPPMGSVGAPQMYAYGVQPQLYMQHANSMPFPYSPIVMQQQGRWPQQQHFQHQPPMQNMHLHSGGRNQFQRRQGNGRTNRQFRNNHNQVQQGAADVPAQQDNVQSAEAPLTLEEVLKHPVEDHAAIIGERLFHLISPTHPSLAGKITGMLLDRLNYPGGLEEIIQILADKNALAEKLHEALEVLQAHSKPEDEQA